MSGKIGFRNNASAVLAEAMEQWDEWLYVHTELWDKFAPPDGADYVVATLGDPAGDCEIVHLSSPQYDGSGLRFVVARGQEGTSNAPWPVGTPIQALLTAGGLKALLDGAGGFTGDGGGNLLAGADAAAPEIVMGYGSPVVALIPGSPDRQVSEFVAGSWVSAGELVVAGAYEYLMLNEGYLGSSLSIMSRKSGEVNYISRGRSNERKLEGGAVLIGANALPAGQGSVVIGDGATGAGDSGAAAVVIGNQAIGGWADCVALGAMAEAMGEEAMALGSSAKAQATRSIAIRTTVDVPDAWAIAGVPLMGEGAINEVTAYPDKVGAAPEGAIALHHTDIGVIRAWSPDMTVRAGDVVVPTTGGDYLYVAQLKFDPDVEDNSAQTGAEEPEFSGYFSFEENITWAALNISAGRMYQFEVPSHVMFYVTEIGFLSTTVGAATAAAQISFGTEDAPTLVLNQVALPGPLGEHRMHRLPIENAHGLTGVVRITLDTPVADGHYQGRFYLRGVFARTRG